MTEYLLGGDKSIVVQFGNEISEEINRRVISFMRAIELSHLKESGVVIEMVPTYRSLMINYEPLRMGYDELVGELKNIEQRLDDIELPEPMVHKIGVCYGGEYGPDLKNVAEHNGLTEKEVIDIHTSGEYLIYMLGFTPGFPYLGGMDERIATPRLLEPRTAIPAGSVGIAGAQTGVYPIQSPGGWQIIGRTPIKLYDDKREDPILLRAGDFIKFVEIDEEEFKRLAKE